MKAKTFLAGALCTFALGSALKTVMAGEESPELSDQRMADSPEALIRSLGEVSFLTPEQMAAKRAQEIDGLLEPMNIEQSPQILGTQLDPRAPIRARDIAEYLDHLTGISIRSKEDGNLIWGRVQGTKYEREASDYVEARLREFGFEDVRKDLIPARRPLWHLENLELSVITAPGFESGHIYRFDNALTAYQSATTPTGGIEAEVIFVGEGTPAELSGRDLAGKIVLLRSRGLPGGLFHSARTAYSRIVIGEYGMPKGIIVWSDIPNSSVVATRVGAIGGGNNLGLALPWTVINNQDGYYLRKLLDRATPQQPVRMRLDVQGEEQGPDKRFSYNVYGVLPGQSGKYILQITHIDGFLYAQHCNGGGVAMQMAMARHYAALPAEQRQHGLIFLFVGDHENPGVGATDKFVEANRELMERDLLVVLRPEKPGMVQELDEGWISSVPTNVMTPQMLMVTNRSPLLIDLFGRAATLYNIATMEYVYPDPASDETNFHPPYFDAGVISAGWATGTRYYHTTGDYENNLVRPEVLEKQGRAYAYVIDELMKYDKSDLERGGTPYTAEKSIYQSDILKLLLGNH